MEHPRLHFAAFYGLAYVRMAAQVLVLVEPGFPLVSIPAATLLSPVIVIIVVEAATAVAIVPLARAAAAVLTLFVASTVPLSWGWIYRTH